MLTTLLGALDAPLLAVVSRAVLESRHAGCQTWHSPGSKQSGLSVASNGAQDDPMSPPLTVMQLASEKIEMRLGGIYTLERISRESSADYWTVMETLGKRPVSTALR